MWLLLYAEEHSLGLLMLWFLDSLASFMKLSVISPNTIHIRGLTVPFAMAISIPMAIIKMSQPSANLNYTCMSRKSREHLMVKCWSYSRGYLKSFISNALHYQTKNLFLQLILNNMKYTFNQLISPMWRGQQGAALRLFCRLLQYFYCHCRSHNCMENKWIPMAG